MPTTASTLPSLTLPTIGTATDSLLATLVAD